MQPGVAPEIAGTTLVTVNAPLLRIVSSTTTPRASDGPVLSTKTVHRIGSPALIVVSGLQSLDVTRSARSSTIAVSVAVLFAGLASATPSWLIDTVFVIAFGPDATTASDRTATLMLKVLLAPLARAPSWHVTVDPSAVQPAGAASVLVTYVTSGGNVSTTVAFVASSGPELVAVMS